MAASAQCSNHAQSVSHAPQAATGQAVTRAPGHGPETAGGHPLPPSPGGGRGGWWERSFPGKADQLSLLRTALEPLLADCPMADDVILLMSEMGANAVRHTSSGRDGGIFTARLLDLQGQYVLGVIEDGGSDWDGNVRDSARDASGLYLVLALSADCGVYGGRHKRAVWFRINYPPADHASSAAHAGVPSALPVRAPGRHWLPFSVPLRNPPVTERAIRRSRGDGKGPRGSGATVNAAGQSAHAMPPQVPAGSIRLDEGGHGGPPVWPGRFPPLSPRYGVRPEWVRRRRKAPARTTPRDRAGATTVRSMSAERKRMEPGLPVRNSPDARSLR